MNLPPCDHIMKSQFFETKYFRNRLVISIYSIQMVMHFENSFISFLGRQARRMLLNWLLWNIIGQNDLNLNNIPSHVRCYFCLSKFILSCVLFSKLLSLFSSTFYSVDLVSWTVRFCDKSLPSRTDIKRGSFVNMFRCTKLFFCTTRLNKFHQCPKSNLHFG